MRPSGGAAHFAAFDGNGNVVGLIDGSDGTISARYDYDVFGQTIRLTGAMARDNAFRFSTKRTEPTTGLVLYEYRAYSPSMGRWPNRDPIGENGGGNLYCASRNDSNDRIDFLGLATVAFYNGCDVGDADLPWYKRCLKLCPNASGLDFSQAAKAFDYAFDLCMLGGSDSDQTYAAMLSKLADLKKLGIPISEIAFIDHGTEGYQGLGPNAGLTTAMSTDQKKSMKAIGDLLNSNGKISLYGCQAGKNVENLQFWADAFGRTVEGQSGNLRCWPLSDCRRAGNINSASPTVPEPRP